MLRTWFLVIFGIGLLSSMLNNCSRRSSVTGPGADRSRVVVLDRAGGGGSSGGTTTVSDGAIELQRSSDGHFYAEVQINGSTIRALVDTGASGIALSRADASSAGIATSIGMPDVVGEGADGDVHGEVVKLDRVTLGHKTAEGMSAVVLSNGEQSLLGQSFLSKFDTVEIRGDVMVLR